MKEVGNLPVLEQVRSKVDGFKRTGKRPRDGCEWKFVNGIVVYLVVFVHV